MWAGIAKIRTSSPFTTNGGCLINRRETSPDSNDETALCREANTGKDPVSMRKTPSSPTCATTLEPAPERRHTDPPSRSTPNSISLAKPMASSNAGDVFISSKDRSYAANDIIRDSIPSSHATCSHEAAASASSTNAAPRAG